MTNGARAFLSVSAILVLAAPAPMRAEEQRTSISGRCQYSDKVAQHRHETALILCDTVGISRAGGAATLDFSRQSWGSMARFEGDMPGDIMTVSQVTLRDGSSRQATGTCRIFHREDGELSVISCLAQMGARSVAANFVPSRL